MKHFQRQFSFILMFIMLFLVAGCGRQQNTGTTIPGVDLPGLISRANQYYSEGRQMETDLTNLWRAYEMSMNTFRTGAGDLIANNDSCFANVAETESKIADAVLGDMPSDALINALTTSSVSGEVATAECVQLSRQLADYIIANRARIQDANLAAFGAATDYLEYTTSSIEVDIMNDLLQTYGSTAGAYEFLKDKAGITITDWGWLPTSGIEVAHGNKVVCDYYRNGTFMQELPNSIRTKYHGHEDALLADYETTWNSATNLCTMTGYAAIEWMKRPIVSASTRGVIDSGVDEGIFPQP